jgi:Ca2+-binding RTX toxin-like protein
VHSQALADTGAVVITGGGQADKLTVDFNTPFSVPNGILFTDAFTGDSDNLKVAGKANVWNILGGNGGNVDRDGFLDFFGIENLTGGDQADTFVLEAGGGVDGVVDGGEGDDDSLKGADTDNTWEITALDAGALNEQIFESIENLIGGEYQDTFVLADDTGVAGLIDGGNGSNTLDYSAYTSDVTVNLEDDTATGTGEISNIQNLTGGAGNDTLIGPDADTTWNIQGTNVGLVAGLNFSGFENLTGGIGADTFVFFDGAGISGKIDGGIGGGVNTLDYSRYTTDVDADLGAGTSTGTGGVSNIQNVTGGSGSDMLAGDEADNILVGGAGEDTLSGGSGQDNLVGGDDSDTLAESRDADFTLTDGSLTIGSEGTDTFTGIDKVELTGRMGANRMDASGYTGNAVLTGEDGADIFIAGTGTITYVGGIGNDTLQGEDQANLWDIIRLNAGFLNDNLIDELIVYQAGSILGDSSRGMFTIEPLAEMTARKEFQLADVRRVGSDLRLIWRPKDAG